MRNARPRRSVTVFGTLSNCMNATSPSPPVTSDRPEVRNRVEDAGEQPHDDVSLEAEPPQRQRRRDGDERARQHLHAHEALDLPVDLVEDLNASASSAGTSARRFCTSFRLYRVAGDQEEVDEEHRRARTGRGTRAASCRPTTGRSSGMNAGVDDLDRCTVCRSAPSAAVCRASPTAAVLSHFLRRALHLPRPPPRRAGAGRCDAIAQMRAPPPARGRRSAATWSDKLYDAEARAADEAARARRPRRAPAGRALARATSPTGSSA